MFPFGAVSKRFTVNFILVLVLLVHLVIIIVYLAEIKLELCVLKDSKRRPKGDKEELIDKILILQLPS